MRGIKHSKSKDDRVLIFAIFIILLGAYIIWYWKDKSSISSETASQKQKRVEQEQKIREEEKIAFHNLRFGDSESVVKSKLDDDPKITITKGSFRDEYEAEIGNRTYEIEPKFYKGKLYGISIHTPFYYYSGHALIIDIAIDNWKHLLAILTEKYDKEYLIYTLDDYSKIISSNYMSFTQIWKYGTKKISLGLSTSRAEVFIVDSQIEELIRQENKSREKDNLIKSIEDF